MASEHLMKASLPSLMVAAHTPFLVVELHIVHTTPFSLLQPQISCQVLLATCLLNPFSSDHLSPATCLQITCYPTCRKKPIRKLLPGSNLIKWVQNI